MIVAGLTLLLGIVVITLVIAANGLFVAQEFAYMSVDRTELRARAEGGNRKAAQALKITDRTSFMLSGAQLGITVTGLMVGFLVEPFVGQPLGVLMGGAGNSTPVAVGVGTVLALVVSTIVQMIFAELFPKNYAIAAPMKSSLALARLTSIYLKMTGWLVTVFDVSSNMVLRLFRIEPIEDVDSTVTAEDLDYIVGLSGSSGALDNQTFLVLDRVLDFPGQDVGHAMVPRSQVDVVAPLDEAGHVWDLMATGHTRYPVIDEEHTPVGVVYLVDLLEPTVSRSTPVAEVMRPAIVMPESMALPDAVNHLRQREEKLACVIDEYGGFIGIITLEDLAEEILGDVPDEHDLPSSVHISSAGVNQWHVEGIAPLDEVERAIGYGIPAGDYETMSGFVLSQAGELAERGDTFSIDVSPDADDLLDPDNVPARRLDIQVEQVDRHVPSLVRITLIEGGP